MGGWIDRVKTDPLPWLLEEETPAVRHLALRDLLDRPSDDAEVVAARAAAMRADPIASILAAQNPEGWWAKPGHGYGPKYTGTVWQVIFLDQLGADGDDPRIRRACEYVLEHSQSSSGGFGAMASGLARPAPSGVLHCLNGNLLRALIGFGLLDDPRVAALAGLAGGLDHRRGRDRVLQVHHGGAGLSLRHQLRRSLRLGSHEGRPGARPRPAPSDERRRSRERSRRARHSC